MPPDVPPKVRAMVWKELGQLILVPETRDIDKLLVDNSGTQVSVPILVDQVLADGRCNLFASNIAK